jgi:hypothetical protein
VRDKGDEVDILVILPPWECRAQLLVSELALRWGAGPEGFHGPRRVAGIRFDMPASRGGLGDVVGKEARTPQEVE